MHSPRRAPDFRRGYDGVPRRARWRAADLWRSSGSDGAWKSDRWRITGWRVRRTRGNHGSALAARSRLSGRHALGKSSRDGGGSGAIARAGADRWLDSAGKNWRAVRRIDARDTPRTEGRLGLSPHRFDVLSLFHDGTGDGPRQRKAKRPGKIRRILQSLSRSRRLLCAVAIRNRILIDGSYG